MNERGIVVWFTGRPSSGKSTLARAALTQIHQASLPACLLDGDEVRARLVPALGYSPEEREAFYATLANLAGLLASQGLVVLVAATAAQRAFRDQARASAPCFIEVFVDVPLEECMRRDAKGLYEMAKHGEARDIPGFDMPYEPPLAAELTAQGGEDENALERLIELIFCKITSPANERC